MAGKFKTRWFWADWAKRKDKEEYSQRLVSLADYAQKLQDACELLEAEGYDVISVVPISAGSSESMSNRGGAYLGDTGFSPTIGAVVVGKKQGG